MLASFLMGLVGGQRALTPLAAVSVAAARHELPPDNGAPALLRHPLVVAGVLTLAAAEMAGDKLASAPDRIVPSGLAARFVTAALAGAALASRRHRWRGAVLGGAAAVAAAYPGWRLRFAATRRHGQIASGFVEDAAVAAAATGAVRAHRR